MAEDLNIEGNSKEEKYDSLIPQIKSLIEGEADPVANLGNIISALKYGMSFFWVGIYRVDGDELVLHVFQGPVACTRIKKGKGVCGSSWNERRTLIVPDVDQFPGHIACSSLSKSEIVIPGFDMNGDVTFVLDVDSENYNTFDSVDEKYLAEVVSLINKELQKIA